MTIQTSKQLGATVRARRRELGVTQKDLAMTGGTGLRFVVDLEKGKATCQVGKILQLLQVLGLALAVERPGNGRPGGKVP
jgi:HTH-type transcriptional regulator / antitoxin HipB